MPNLDHLYEIDERFKAFENHKEGLLVSLAGPGTGKTYSLLRRVASLANLQGINLDSICYLTFIKDITKAFQSDYEEEFQQDDEILTYPRISTLHSFACRIIRNRGFSIGYDGELFFTSVAQKPDTFESKVFVRDLIFALNHPNLNTTARTRSELLKIKEAWRSSEDPGNLSGLPAIAYNGYLNLTRVYRLIDWDHTIPLALVIYQIPENRQAWISRIQHLLIDEFQDFNKSEQSLILAMASEVSSLIIVGDDDQSLYNSRGGSPEAIRTLFQSGGTDQISLVRCRRCRSNIIEHANQLLVSINPNPRLMLPFHDGGLVDSFQFISSKSEIEFLAGFLNECIDRLPDNPRPRDGIICLFPTLRSLRFYYEKLSSLVNCYTNKVKIEEPRQRLINAVNLFARPRQRFCERLLIEYFPEIKQRHKKLVLGKVMEMDISPSEACQILISEDVITGIAVPSIEAFIAISQSLSSRDIESIVRHLTDWTEVNADELVGLLDSLIISLNNNDQEEAIAEFCDAALPNTALPQNDLHSIQFLTMHSAKGLTKNTVVMPGLEDAWLPGTAAGAALEERRRLFYVSLTRATDRVLITHPIHRARGDKMNYDCPGRSRVSRFVNESGIVTIFHG